MTPEQLDLGQIEARYETAREAPNWQDPNLLIEALTSSMYDVPALVAEVQRLRSITDRIDGLAKRQVGNEPSGGESRRGWIYAHHIFAVLDELETR